MGFDANRSPVQTEALYYRATAGLLCLKVFVFRYVTSLAGNLSKVPRKGLNIPKHEYLQARQARISKFRPPNQCGNTALSPLRAAH